MKTNYFNQNLKGGFIAFVCMFCCLFANMATAQDSFTWNGSTSSDWATAANWDKVGAGASTYPGQSAATDLVIIDDNSKPNAPVISGAVSNAVAKVTISNANGTAAGPTLTINVGGTLVVTGSVASSGVIELSGGNLVNNGNLTLTNTNTGSITFGIQCSTPAQLPLSPTEWGYSGSGTLTVDISTATGNTEHSAFNVGGVDGFAGNSTYKFIFNGTTNISLANGTGVLNTYAVRTGGTAAGGPIPAIIGGTGFTLTLAGNKGGLVRVGAASTITVDTGTTLTLNSASTNTTFGINLASQSTIVTKFINKGTINIFGNMPKAAINLSHGGGSNYTGTEIMYFENQNVVNIVMNGTGTNAIPLYVVNNGAAANPGNLTIKNTSTATMTLTNNEPIAANIGNALKIANASATPTVNFTNDGILNLTGTDVVYDNIFKSTITNNGTINTNQAFLWKIENNVTGIISANNPTDAPFISKATTNSGIINTGEATGLSKLFGVTTEASSVINPGGTSGKGIADFNDARSYLLRGTFNLQIDGDTTPGVDFDQIIGSDPLTVLDLDAATLDVTGIYTPAGATTIDVVTTEATTGVLVGEFASVVGLGSDWHVQYTANPGGKVQLMYVPPLSVKDLAKFGFNSYPNPAKDHINLSAAKSIDKIEIYNLLGQQVRAVAINSSKSVVNVANLSRGVYVAKVFIEGAVGSYKFIKD